MEAGELIQFDQHDYVIKKIVYRTKGSLGQKLTDAKDKKKECRRVFYVVEKDDQLFWVKEYADPSYGHSIQYEYDETCRLAGQTTVGKHSISAVDMLGINNNRILMEYLKDYRKLSQMRKAKSATKRTIRTLIETWLKEHDAHDYDLCDNNIMLKMPGGVIDIKLLDFEFSTGINKKQWKIFLKTL